MRKRRSFWTEYPAQIEMRNGISLTVQFFTDAVGLTAHTAILPPPAEWTPQTPNTAKHLTVCSVRRAAVIAIPTAARKIWAEVVMGVTFVRRLFALTAVVNVWVATLLVVVREKVIL